VVSGLLAELTRTSQPVVRADERSRGRCCKRFG
jgi:hypothetical protein